MKRISKLESGFDSLLVSLGLSEKFRREYLFHPTRKWRFDFADPINKVAVELEGGIWVNGRHSRGSGFVGDVDKYNQATILGWRVLRYTSKKQYDEFKKHYSEILGGIGSSL